MNEISGKESKLLYSLYEKIVRLDNNLNWVYFEGGHLDDELPSLHGVENYHAKIGNLNILLHKAHNSPVRLIVSATEGAMPVTLYDGSNDVSINLLYTYLSRQREGEEEQKRKQAEQESCAPLEELLAALDQPKKAKKAGRKK